MGNNVVHELKFDGKTVQIVHGDITREEVDAVVNAANSYLQHGGGVAGAIVRRGGRIIQEESNRLVKENGPVPVGEAVVTSAGSLKAKFVIHTVGPRWGEGNEDEKLKNAVRNALKRATELGLKSISLPAISTGIFGFPKDRGAEIILGEVIRFLKEEDTSLELVRICNIDLLTTNIFVEKASKFA